MREGRAISMTRGNITALLIQFAIPMLIANIVQQTYSMADSIVLGQHLGANALASVGATTAVRSLINSVFSGLASGCGVVAAQCFGAGDEGRTRRAIANAAYVMFLSALLTGVIAYAAMPFILETMNTHPDILHDATVYMRVSCMGFPMVAAFNYSASMLRALGDSRTTLIFSILSCVLNIVLDLLFVCVLEMGVPGAALATVIAQSVAGFGCLAFALKMNPYFRFRREDFRADTGMIGQAMRIGLPQAFQWALIALSSTILQVFVNSFDDTVVVAAFSATNTVEQLLHKPYVSISAALTTFAGQNWGAKDLGRVRAGLRRGLAMSFAFTVVMTMIFQLASGGLMGLFVKEAEVIDMGAHALRLTSWFYLALALIYVVRGTLNGVGDALFSLINGVVELLCRIGLPVLTAMIPGVTFWGVWWTAGLTWSISALFCLLRYFSWCKKAKRGLHAEVA